MSAAIWRCWFRPMSLTLVPNGFVRIVGMVLDPTFAAFEAFLNR